MTKTEILKFRVTPEEKEIITHKALRISSEKYEADS